MIEDLVFKKHKCRQCGVFATVMDAGWSGPNINKCPECGLQLEELEG